MNAVAFITDFICKDSISSLDGFYASLTITACSSKHTFDLFIVVLYQSCNIGNYIELLGLHLVQGCPPCTSQLPPGRLRTSLRAHHSVDVAKKPVFCCARCCTSTEQKGREDSSLRHSTDVLVLFSPAHGHLLPEAHQRWCLFPSKLGMVFKETLGHSS